MDRGSIRANLLDSYLKLAKGKKGIIYSISRKHSLHICSEYKQAGINIVCIDSETPRNERRLYVQRFKNGLIDIIVNVDIFSEGFDCPDIEFIQLARPTKSLVKYLQQVGRGLRPTAGKSKCVILDNVGAHIEFDLPDADRAWETEFEGETQQRKRRTTNTERRASANGERRFEEGADELSLIEDIENKGSIGCSKNAPQEVWTDSDNDLLRMLYVDRKCPIEVISSVFRKDKKIIESQIIKLNL